MSLVGGLRARLLHDSLANAITDALATLGWFDTGRHHRPVRVVAEPMPWQDPITPNLIAISSEGSTVEYRETGSLLTDDTGQILVDVYAEGDSLGFELSNDIRDILRGRIGDTLQRAVVPIYDYRQATPPVIGGAAIDDVVVSRSSVLDEKVWLRHWFTITCELHDCYYGGEP